MRIFLLIANAVIVASTPAWANSPNDSLTEVAKCADVPAATERLACYDKAVADAKVALAGGSVQEAAIHTGEEEEGGVLRWFGISERKPVTKPQEFGMPAEKEITEMSAAVVELTRAGYDRAIFVLDNGQIWRQIDGDTMEVRDSVSPSRSLQVKIERSVFGAYTLRINGRNGFVKVRRVK